jgi:hypothetical protein
MSGNPTIRGADVPGHGLDVGWVLERWPTQSGDAPDLVGIQGELARAGHRIHIACTSPAGERAGAVSVRRVQTPKNAAEAALVGRSLSDQVLAWLAETPCDVVHVFGADELSRAAFKAAEDTGRPCVWSHAVRPPGAPVRAEGPPVPFARAVIPADGAPPAEASAALLAGYEALLGRAGSTQDSAAPAGSSSPSSGGFLRRWFGR